jgi:hypothetical protein
VTVQRTDQRVLTGRVVEHDPSGIAQTFVARFKHDDGRVTYVDDTAMTTFRPGPDGLLEVECTTRGRGSCVTSRDRPLPEVRESA